MDNKGNHTINSGFRRNKEMSFVPRMTDAQSTQVRVNSQSLPHMNTSQPQFNPSIGVTSNQYYAQPAHQRPQESQYRSPQVVQVQQTSGIFTKPFNYQTPESFKHVKPTNSFKSTSFVLSPKSVQRELDVGKLLISMAEEYFEAAHKLVPYTVRMLSNKFIEKHQNLVALGLGCLEAALKRVTSLDPRDEACIRLRYAGVLFEETENIMEAETTLSKGIELCERNHYYDLKYSMYFLLAQCVAKSNLKASIKALDAYISEAETYSNLSWVYAFRFLRASYSLQSGTFIDNNAAVRNLRVVSQISEQHGDRPIHFVASLMVVVAYLKIAGPEALQNLKSSMASVWSHQMDTNCHITPLIVLAHILDLACSIREGDPQIMMTKLHAARNAMDASIRNKDWGTDDIISIPIQSSANCSRVVSPDTGMVLGIGDDGTETLILTLLDQKDAYCISCLLYGVVLLNRSANERLPALKYLYQGLLILENDNDLKSPKNLSNKTLSSIMAKYHWRGQMLCYIRVYIAFCHSLSAEWCKVKNCLEDLQKILEKFEIPITRHLQSLLIYLSGIFYQGSGDLDNALKTFQDPRFKISAERSSNTSAIEQMEFDISILAGLNALSILQHPKRFDPVRNRILLNMLEPVCIGHSNQDIVNAFNLIMVTVKTDSPKTFMQVKHHLSAALNGAKKTNNSQLLSITVTLMFSSFFVGRIGTQAENGAQAASRTASKSGNPLWMSVADNLLARCNELHGKTEDAQKTLELALKSAEKVSIEL